MIIDEDICKLLSAKEGLPLDFIIKEMYLMELLRMLSSEGILKGMVFKGGTALNNVYIKGDRRFSEDLDFDFSGQEWNTVKDKLLLNSDTFISHDSRYFRSKTIYQVDYLYKIPSGKADRVRADVNFSPKIKTVDKIENREVTSKFIGVNVSNVPTYGLEDLLARKMHALKDRAEGKDIFDVNNAITLADKPKLLKAIGCVIEISAEKMKPTEFIDQIISKLSNLDHKKLRNLTNPYIPIRSRPSDWTMLTDELTEELVSLRNAE